MYWIKHVHELEYVTLIRMFNYDARSQSSRPVEESFRKEKGKARDLSHDISYIAYN